MEFTVKFIQLKFNNSFSIIVIYRLTTRLKLINFTHTSIETALHFIRFKIQQSRIEHSLKHHMQVIHNWKQGVELWKVHFRYDESILSTLKKRVFSKAELRLCFIELLCWVISTLLKNFPCNRFVSLPRFKVSLTTTLSADMCAFLIGFHKHIVR